MGRKTDKTVLIVDDTPENISILAELLSEYNIKIATNGKKALEIVDKAEVIDLILLDVMMPEMNGFEVAKNLKKNPLKKHIPIFFITASTDSKSFIEGFESGGEEYISKPFDPDQVLRIVHQYFEKF